MDAAVVCLKMPAVPAMLLLIPEDIKRGGHCRGQGASKTTAVLPVQSDPHF